MHLSLFIVPTYYNLLTCINNLFKKIMMDNAKGEKTRKEKDYL